MHSGKNCWGFVASGRRAIESSAPVLELRGCRGAKILPVKNLGSDGVSLHFGAGLRPEPWGAAIGWGLREIQMIR
jgi:hypothetical protein